jgi:hypothetical protein
MTLTSFERPQEALHKITRRYFGGLDVGQKNDPTTFVAVREERRLFTTDLWSKDPQWQEETPTVYQVGYVERLPLGTTYPAVVNYIARLLQRPTWAGNIELVIDQTGVGRPVCDMFASAGIPFIAVTITGGDTENRDSRNHWRVPKGLLVSAVQALLHEGRLHIHKELPDEKALTRELQDFRIDFTATGHMTFAAKVGKHDDIVLALALAVWRSRKRIIKPTVIPMSAIAMRNL